MLSFLDQPEETVAIYEYILSEFPGCKENVDRQIDRDLAIELKKLGARAFNAHKYEPHTL